jgi:competence ComEA-like helix-hairpin-helix protein
VPIAPGPKPAGRLVNANTATAAELEALPGIGPVIAQRIIEGRPYRSVDDLDRVKGIGKKRLEEIRPLVTVE